MLHSANLAVTNPLEVYLRELRDIHRSGSAVPETSYYPALRDLMDAVGATLKPKVRCILHVSHGAGIPDGGLFTPDQFPKGPEPLPGTVPTRGVIEAKSTSDDAFLTADTKQVSKYWGKYRQVLVTNYRDFLLLGTDAEGKPVKLERYRLASDEKSFWAAAEHPQTMAERHGEAFAEFIRRVLLHAARLDAPKDVAWFMASHARDALRRVEHHAEMPALTEIRKALEEALGIKFEGERGDHFFHSTLVQTLFYGAFSAWVLWTHDHPSSDIRARFEWRTAGYYLRVPVLQELFHRVATPGALAELGLEEVLDWTGAVLNRIDRANFFAAFEQHHAVQYFYEPFLEAYDPELRKQLGVWYTPREVVLYMVERVDRVLREELGLADGLANPNVYVLDPCCGTGSYLVEVLNRIAATLKEKGGNGLIAQEVKRAAKERVFGFEILPAPFVVAHLQLGLLLQSMGAPLSEAKKERAGIYLTNALTGWEPPDGSKPQLLFGFPELMEERDAAEAVKREKPILVVLGNPPYNAFAGVSGSEEHGFVDVYKAGLISAWGIKKFNLDDLYVRFFRLAERRIAEKTGLGVVAFISNFSYLSDPSFVVMRRRFLQEFDAIWIDCLNGDSRETGKLCPDGSPDPSIFSTEYNREGIRVGTAINTMVRNRPHASARAFFRQFWGTHKATELLERRSATRGEADYVQLNPTTTNRFALRAIEIAEEYHAWPSVVLFPEFGPTLGVLENRGDALIDVDRKALEARILRYHDSELDWDSVKGEIGALAQDAARFDAQKTREKVLRLEKFDPARVRRLLVRPMDVRWCYFSLVRPLWNDPRPAYAAQAWRGNASLMTRRRGVANPEGVPFHFTSCLGAQHAFHKDAYCVPLMLRSSSLRPRANLSKGCRRYLHSIGIRNPDEDSQSAALIWMHVLAIGYARAYRRQHSEALRPDWPRIPLPDSKDALLHSAELGRKIAALLDTESPVPEVTEGTIRPELRVVAVAARSGGGSLNPDAGDLDVTAGWGHAGKGGAVMPGKGKLLERDFSAEEREAISEGAKALEMNEQQALTLLGERAFDIYLNNVAYWKNIPAGVWEYTIGGYHRTIKKWLSYRERDLLGRELKMDEVYEVRDIARRIAAILLLTPQLDANYDAVKKSTYQWPSAT
jgi:hypothetical protein